jgi:hypothetical protein
MTAKIGIKDLVLLKVVHQFVISVKRLHLVIAKFACYLSVPFVLWIRKIIVMIYLLFLDYAHSHVLIAFI